MVRTDGDLATLADVLLPGDEHFPSASVTGAHGLLAERSRERLGSDAVGGVLGHLSAAAVGQPLASLDPAARVAAVQRFERDEPELFAAVRNILYFSYYQSPIVVAAIRELGIAYNDAPQPLGYAMDPFDATPGMDAPAQPRGSYIATEAVTRVAALPPAARQSASEQ